MHRSYRRTLDNYLVEELTPYLTQDIRQVLPDEIWQIIASYWELNFRVLLNNLKALHCPITQKIFREPVIITSDLISPIVYEEEAVLNAIEAGELKDFNVNAANVQPLPFVKNLIQHLKTISTQLDLTQESKELETITIESKEQESNTSLSEINLLAELKDSVIISQNNLAQQLHLAIQSAKQKNKTSVDIIHILKNFDWPLIENKNRRETLLCKIGAHQFSMMLTASGNNRKRFKKQVIMGIFANFSTLLPLLLDAKISIELMPLYLFLTPLFIVNKTTILNNSVEYLHNKRNLLLGQQRDDFHRLNLFFALFLFSFQIIMNLDELQVNRRNFLSITAFNIFSSLNSIQETMITLASWHFIADTRKRNAIRPFPSQTIFHLLMAGMLCMALVVPPLINQKNDSGWVFSMSFASAILNGICKLPRIYISTKQTLRECKEGVKAMKHNPSLLFKPSPNTQGFRAENKTEYTASYLGSLARISSAALMGMITYLLTEDPYYTLLVGLVIWIESSLKNVVNGENNQYRLKQN